MARLKAGDREAFGVLYGWYGECLFKEVLLPRLGRRELAEDVLRDTFRIVLERIEKYEPEADKSIYFWIRRIAINRATDVFRAQQRTRRLEEAVGAEARVQAPVVEPDRGMERRDTRSRIDRALDRLSPRYAEAIRLRLLEELDREVCAERLGVTLGNFDVILHRAAAAFRNTWEAEED